MLENCPEIVRLPLSEQQVLRLCETLFLQEATAAPPVDAAEEEARAERKRRQRQAQEEFRQRQMAKQKTDEKQELQKNCSSFDQLLMELPSQDIVIQETGDSVDDAAKRKSALEGSATKRRASVINRLDIVEAD